MDPSSRRFTGRSPRRQSGETRHLPQLWWELRTGVPLLRAAPRQQDYDDDDARPAAESSQRCALAGTDCRPPVLRRRAGRPQLKRSVRRRASTIRWRSRVLVHLNLSDLLDYTDWERQKWQAWFLQHGADVLKITAGPHGDGRFGAVGDLVRHIFSAEKRYVERLSGRSLTDTASI